MTSQARKTAALQTLKETYERLGYVFPVRAMSTNDMLAIREGIETYIAGSGRNTKQDPYLQYKVHLVFPWADRLIRNAAILDAVETLIGHYGKMIDIAVVVDKDRESIAIGDYVFARSSFQELIKYVWRGGYPRWKDEVRPQYVLDMKKTIEQSEAMLFDGLQLEMV